MSALKRVGSWTLVLVLGFAVGACEKQFQSPEPEGQLDPTEIASTLDVVNSTFQTPQFKSLEALGRMELLPGSGGVVLNEAGDLIRHAAIASAVDGPGARDAYEAQRVLALGRALTRATDETGSLARPPLAAGTYEWDVSQQAYVHSSAGADASSASSSCGEVTRIVLYAMDPATGEPIEPPVVTGYVDLVYLCAGGIEVTLVGADGVTYMYFVLVPTASGLALDGFLSNGAVVVNVDVDYVENESYECANFGDCVGSTYRFDALFSVEGTPVRMAVLYYFTFTETGFEVQRGFTLYSNVEPIAMLTTEFYEAIGPNTFWVTFYTEVHLGADLFGIIDATRGELLYLLPNGEPMTQEDIAALQALLAEPAALQSAIAEMLTPLVNLLGEFAGNVIPPILIP